jgi:hypothetical protein
VVEAHIGELQQVKHMMNYCVNVKRNNVTLLNYLKQKNWSEFALGYNGPKALDNGYHTKLANAYAKWQRIVN